MTAESHTAIIRRSPPAAKPRRFEPRRLLMALFLGALVWIVVDAQRMEERPADVPLDLSAFVPAGWQILDGKPTVVKVTLRGPGRTFAEFRNDELSIHPALSAGIFEHEQYDGTVRLLPENIRGRPAGTTVVSVVPAEVRLRCAREMPMDIDVVVGEVKGTPAAGHTVGNVSQPDPPVVVVHLTKQQADRLGPKDTVRTAPMDITDARGRKTASLEFLPLVVDGVEIPVPGHAFVTVDLPAVATQREIPEVAVRALLSVGPFNNRFADFSFDPPNVTVTVEGSQATVERLTVDDIIVYADHRRNVSTGKPDEFRVRLRAVPRDPGMETAVVKIEPETVTWIVGPPKAPVTEPPETEEP